MPSYNEKLIATKEAWARAGRGQSGAVGSGRLPPGQHIVQGLPILDLGERPVVPQADWKLTAGGAVGRPVEWNWKTLLSRPQTSITVDIHCVTTWSSYDNTFTGVLMGDFLEQVKPRSTAAFVMVRSFDGYSTNLSLADLASDNALIAHSWNGAPLSREHGGPVRLIIPHLYFWKSAKWLRHFTFMDRDQPGYWEARGYHKRGEPFAEQRYG